MSKSLTKQQLLAEAKLQQEALQQLGQWMVLAMAISTCGFALAWWGFALSPLPVVIGPVGVVLTAVAVFCAAILGLGIRNGRRNVEHILKAAER